MMPSIFLAHGSPFLLDDQGWVGELKAWSDALPRPTSILMLSAHWEERPITLGATTTVPLVYDFYGFPAKYYGVRYAAPGAPELAKRVRALVSRTQPVVEDPARAGWITAPTCRSSRCTRPLMCRCSRFRFRR